MPDEPKRDPDAHGGASGQDAGPSDETGTATGAAGAARESWRGRLGKSRVWRNRLIVATALIPAALYVFVQLVNPFGLTGLTGWASYIVAGHLRAPFQQFDPAHRPLVMLIDDASLEGTVAKRWPLSTREFVTHLNSIESRDPAVVFADVIPTALRPFLPDVKDDIARLHAHSLGTSFRPPAGQLPLSLHLGAATPLPDDRAAARVRLADCVDAGKTPLILAAANADLSKGLSDLIAARRKPDDRGESVPRPAAVLEPAFLHDPSKATDGSAAAAGSSGCQLGPRPVDDARAWHAAPAVVQWPGRTFTYPLTIEVGRTDRDRDGESEPIHAPSAALLLFATYCDRQVPDTADAAAGGSGLAARCAWAREVMAKLPERPLDDMVLQWDLPDSSWDVGGQIELWTGGQAGDDTDASGSGTGSEDEEATHDCRIAHDIDQLGEEPGWLSRLVRGLRHYLYWFGVGEDLRRYCAAQPSYPSRFTVSRNHSRALPALAAATEDRAVLVGANLDAQQDAFATPIHESIAGVYLHATAFENLVKWGDDYRRQDGTIGWIVGLLLTLALGVLIATRFQFLFTAEKTSMPVPSGGGPGATGTRPDGREAPAAQDAEGADTTDTVPRVGLDDQQVEQASLNTGAYFNVLFLGLVVAVGSVFAFADVSGFDPALLLSFGILLFPISLLHTGILILGVPFIPIVRAIGTRERRSILVAAGVLSFALILGAAALWAGAGANDATLAMRLGAAAAFALGGTLVAHMAVLTVRGATVFWDVTRLNAGDHAMTRRREVDLTQPLWRTTTAWIPIPLGQVAPAQSDAEEAAEEARRTAEADDTDQPNQKSRQGADRRGPA